jgi:transcriptional regulator with XRE-family HTH domain
MEKKTVSKGDIVIGQRIKKIREEKSMTQKKLAEKVMVSPSSITRLESGQTMVSVFTIIKIAEVLNTSISFLLSGDEDDLNKSDILEIAKKLDRCTAEQREVLLQSFGNILDAFFSS